jgi:hypothetical protein
VLIASEEPWILCGVVITAELDETSHLAKTVANLDSAAIRVGEEYLFSPSGICDEIVIASDIVDDCDTSGADDPDAVGMPVSAVVFVCLLATSCLCSISISKRISCAHVIKNMIQE